MAKTMIRFLWECPSMNKPVGWGEVRWGRTRNLGWDWVSKRQSTEGFWPVRASSEQVS